MRSCDAMNFIGSWVVPGGIGLPLSAFLLLPVREEGPRGRMALSHSSFRASGFARGR